MLIKTASAAILGAAAMLSSAFAQSFDGKDVEAFIAVMEGTDALSAKYEGQEDAIANDLDLDFETADFTSMLDENGEFRIFRLTTDAMERSGDTPVVRDYRALVKTSGFSGLSDYGEKADAIMMAYMATEMDAGDLAEMQSMTPEMMAMMPAGMGEQMAGVMKLVEAVGNVPAEDVATLKPYRKKLDKALD